LAELFSLTRRTLDSAAAVDIIIMYWLHCNECGKQWARSQTSQQQNGQAAEVAAGRITLYLTDCGHVFCEPCLAKSQAAKYCRQCKCKDFKTAAIGPSMPVAARGIFQEVGGQLTTAFKCFRFQMAQSAVLLEGFKTRLRAQDEKLAAQARQLAVQRRQLDEQSKQLDEQGRQMAEQSRQMAEKSRQMADKDATISAMAEENRRLKRELQEQVQQLKARPLPVQVDNNPRKYQSSLQGLFDSMPTRPPTAVCVDTTSALDAIKTPAVRKSYDSGSSRHSRQSQPALGLGLGEGRSLFSPFTQKGDHADVGFAAADGGDMLAYLPKPVLPPSTHRSVNSRHSSEASRRRHHVPNPPPSSVNVGTKRVAEWLKDV